MARIVRRWAPTDLLIAEILSRAPQLTAEERQALAAHVRQGQDAGAAMDAARPADIITAEIIPENPFAMPPGFPPDRVLYEVEVDVVGPDGDTIAKRDIKITADDFFAKGDLEAAAQDKAIDIWGKYDANAVNFSLEEVSAHVITWTFIERAF